MSKYSEPCTDGSLLISYIKLGQYFILIAQMISTETASFEEPLEIKIIGCRKKVEEKLLTAKIKRENYRKGTFKKPKTLTSKAFECKRRASRQYSIGSYGFKIPNFVKFQFRFFLFFKLNLTYMKE